MPRTPHLVSDDLDLLGEGPSPRDTQPKSPEPVQSAPPPKDDPLLPDEIALITAGVARHAPAQPGQKKAAPPAPAQHPLAGQPTLSPSAAQQTLPPMTQVQQTLPPVGRPPVPAPPVVDFFLPADFDPFALPRSKATRSPNFDDDIPVLKDEPVADLLSRDFEIMPGQARASDDFIPVIGGASAQQIAADEAETQDFEEVYEEPRDRVQRREFRRARAIRHRIRTDVRPRWAIVHWSLTVQLIALGCYVLALIIIAFSFFLAFIARAIVGPGILMILSLAFLFLREVLVLVGYGLAIPVPTKNLAWLWAVLALMLSLVSLGGYVAAVIFPLALFLLPLMLISWFCYLIHLMLIADGLKIRYLSDECMSLMRMLLFMVIDTLAMWVIAIVAAAYAPMRELDYVWFWGTCMLILGFVWLIFVAALIYKFYYILINLRSEIGWRLES
jgi:hypothetical protein